MDYRANRLSMAEAGAQIAAALGGVWRPEGAMCRCPVHTDRTPSLSIRPGHSSLLFKCFAGCDTLDILREIRRLKLAVPVHDVGRIALTSDQTGHSDAARRLWEAARDLCGTPGASYLCGRGLVASSAALRFHPRTPLGRGRAATFRPAILAAVRVQGRLVAVQRLFLDPVLPQLASDLVKPKLTLGRPYGGAVRFQPAGHCLGLAEGIETAMAAASLLQIPVWAALGSERLSRITIPPDVAHLLLLPDNDLAGRIGAARALDALARPGLAIETLWPWHGQNDWNDVLRLKNPTVSPVPWLPPWD